MKEVFGMDGGVVGVCKTKGSYFYNLNFADLV